MRLQGVFMVPTGSEAMPFLNASFLVGSPDTTPLWKNFGNDELSINSKGGAHGFGT